MEETEVEESEEAEASTEPMTLRLAFTAEPDVLDPHKTGVALSNSILSWIGSSLVALDTDGNAIPYLAESWDVSEDGLVYTFYLRDDVTFHNGTPLTAQDFVYTFERAVDPETASPVAGPRLGTAVGFEAVDDYTFVVTLEEPFFPFLTSVAVSGYMQPMSQAYVEEMGDTIGRFPMSVGPYKFVEWVTGEHIILERNPDYNWGPESLGSGPYLIERINVNFVPEPAMIVAGLETGEIDYASIETKDVELFQDLGYDILTSTLPGLTPYVAFQTQKPPLDDINIRKALNMAIDRQAVLTLLEQGNGVIQYGPLSSTVIGYWEGVEECGYPYDPEGAKALIEEAGYVLNEDGIYEKDGELLHFILNSGTAETSTKTAEIVQSMLEAIGISVEIQRAESGVLIPQVLGGNYTMTVFGIANPEADILYQMFHSSQIGGFNYSYVNNPELDAILESTRTLVDPVERQQAVNDAQKIITEQAYIIAIYSSVNYSVINPRIKGYEYDERSGLNFTNAYIEE